MIKPINVSKKLSDGREISIETGKLAKQADGSVVLTMGKTMILASVVSKKEAMDNVDFLPLSVDCQDVCHAGLNTVSWVQTIAAK